MGSMGFMGPIDSHRMILEFISILIFGFWEWMPSIGRKAGILIGILPYVQTGLTNWKSRYWPVSSRTYKLEIQIIACILSSEIVENIKQL